MVVEGETVLETLGATVDESFPGTAEAALLTMVGPVGAGASDEEPTKVLLTETEELVELEGFVGVVVELDSGPPGVEEATEVAGGACARSSCAPAPKTVPTTRKENRLRRSANRCLARFVLGLVGLLTLMNFLGHKRGSEREAPNSRKRMLQTRFHSGCWNQTMWGFSSQKRSRNKALTREIMRA